MIRNRVLKPAKQKIIRVLRQAGYNIIAETEYERLLMRDNLAGLLTRAVTSGQPLQKDEQAFLEQVCQFQGTTLSQLFQDLFALFVSQGKNNGYFVEVGVGDGIAHSNTRLLEKGFGWSGVLVEPNFHLWDSIRRNRSAALAPYAASSDEGELVFHRVATAELSYVGKEVPNDNLSRPILDSRSIRARKLDAILEENRAPSGIEYVSIDVEGHELEVLDGFDIERWKPRAITIEYNNDLSRANAIHARLSGYVQVMPALSGCDLWFVRANP